MTSRDGNDRGFLALVLTGAAVYLAHALWPELIPHQGRWIARYGSVIKLGLQLAGAIWASWNAASFPLGSPARRAWRWLGLGLGLVFLGQAWLAQYQLRGATAPYPTWADVAFVLAYAPLVGSLISFLVAYRAAGYRVASRGRDIVIATLATGLGVALAWPVLRAAVLSPSTGPGQWLGIAYPVLDLLLVAPAILVLRAVLPFRHGRVGRVWLAILAGLAAWVVADTLFAWPSEDRWIGPVSNACYVLAYGFLALGTRYQRSLLK